MSAASKHLPVLLTPLGAAFRCSACGDCCRGWGINVDARAYYDIRDALARRPHPGRVRAEDAFTPVEKQVPELWARMRLKDDGACVFLDEDNLCYLHRHFGPEVKPVACRLFPFRPVMRPEGVSAPASLSCRTVRRTLAETTSPPSPERVSVEAEHLRRLAVDRMSPGAYVKLGRGLRLRVELLGQAEERMARLLCDAALGLSERVLGVFYYADELTRQVDRAGPREIALAYARAVGDDGARLRERAACARPDIAMHLGLLFSLLERMKDTCGQDVIERQALHFGMRLGLVREEQEQLAVCVLGWRYTDVEEGLSPLVATYLLERLRASNITSRHGLLSTAAALCHGAALIRFFSCAIAGERQRVVEREDLMQAIYEVDSAFFHNIKVLEMLREDGEELPRSALCAETLCLIPPAPRQTAEATPSA